MRLKIVTKLWEIYYFIFSVIDDHLLCWNCFDNSLWVFFLSFHLKRTAFIFTSVKFNEFSSSKWLCIFIQLMTYCLLTMKSLTRGHWLQICLTVVISLMKEAEMCFCSTEIVFHSMVGYVLFSGWFVTPLLFHHDFIYRKKIWTLFVKDLPLVNCRSLRTWTLSLHMDFEAKHWPVLVMWHMSP